MGLHGKKIAWRTRLLTNVADNTLLCGVCWGLVDFTKCLALNSQKD
jgi:hypothetical protein